MNGSRTRPYWRGIGRALALVVVFLIAAGGVRAGQPMGTLDQSLAQAMEASPAIVAAKAKIAMAQAELRSTQLEIARQIIGLWRNMETQQSEAAVARKKLDRLSPARGFKGPADPEVENARSKLIDAEARLSRTQTELRYLTGQASPSGQPSAVGGGGSADRRAAASEQRASHPASAPAQDATKPAAEEHVSRRASAPAQEATKPVVGPVTTLRIAHGATSEKIRQALAMDAEFTGQAIPLDKAIASLA